MKIIIFAGTTEGRQLAEQYAGAGDSVVACVTGTYARRLIPASIPCHVGPMNAVEIKAFLQREKPDRVIDATHPFAALVTKNVRAACEALMIPIERIEREDSKSAFWANSVEWAEDTRAAVDAVRKTQGRVLLTTGSHTLPQYCAEIPPDRLYVRVLPTSRALLACEALGLPPGHVLAMQGPFTAAFNAALYDQLHISVMVTKDSGEPGGVEEKILPALQRNIHVILIHKPKEKNPCAEKT